MKMNKLLLSIALILSSVLSIQAQTKQEEQLALRVKEFNQAIINTDANALGSMVADELSYGHSSGAIQDKAEFIKKVLEGPTFFKSFDLKDQKITIAGKNAIVRHITTAQAIINKVPGEIKFGNLMVWKKVGGKWILFARQGYKI
jgi:hypothetical protein